MLSSQETKSWELINTRQSSAGYSVRDLVYIADLKICELTTCASTEGFGLTVSTRIHLDLNEIINMQGCQ